MKKILVSVCLFLFATICSFAQGYKISLKINNLRDTIAVVGYYYGKYQYTRDTIQLNHNGVGHYETKDTVGGGIYFVVLPNKQYFEFILDRDRNLYFETDTIDVVKNLKVKGSVDNEQFNEYQKFISEKGELMNNYSIDYKRLKESGTNNDSLVIIDKKMKSLNKEVDVYKSDFMKKYPNSFLTTVFKSTKEPEIPEMMKKNLKNKSDSINEYIYFKNHFWDNIDLTDDRILRTPIFSSKIDQFFTNVLVQVPDTIVKEIDIFVDKTRSNKEMFKYAVWYLTHIYETTKIMGFDAIFVHIVDKYYATGQAWWISEVVTKKIIERANFIRPNLMGNVAPNVALIDTTGSHYLSLHSVKADYVILYFWSYDCGHCAKETPKLVKYFRNAKKMENMLVYSVCTDTSMTEWKKALKEKDMFDFINVNGTKSALGNFHDLYDIYSTPVLYVLDSKKRIIAKRLPVEQLDSYLSFYRKNPMFKD